jgi:hypothetical protein
MQTGTSTVAGEAPPAASASAPGATPQPPPPPPPAPPLTREELAEMYDLVASFRDVRAQALAPQAAATTLRPDRNPEQQPLPAASRARAALQPGHHVQPAV